MRLILVGITISDIKIKDVKVAVNHFLIHFLCSLKRRLVNEKREGGFF